MATTRTSKAKSSKAKKPTAAKTSKSQAAPAVFTPSEPGDTSSEKPAIGRPTDYNPKYAAIARKMVSMGATDGDLAEAFGVTTVTIWNWSTTHPAFFNALKVQKGEFDDRVERSLAQRATGYTFQSEKVFQFQGQVVRAKTTEHVPPDPGACKLWLTNRRRAVWADTSKQELTGKDGAPLIPENINSRETAKAILDILKEARVAEGEGCPGDEVYEDDYVNTDDAVNSYPPDGEPAPCEQCSQPVNTIAAPVNTLAAPVNTAPRRLRFDPALGKLVPED